MATAELEIIQPKVTYNDYSRERKAEVIALVKANGGNVLQTARECGIHHSTIQGWLEREDQFADLQQQVTVALDTKLDKTVHKLIGSIYDHDLAVANLASKATAFGIVFDKLQLLRGAPTSITLDLSGADVAAILSGALSEVIDVTPESE